MPAVPPPLRFQDQADVRRHIESADVPHVKVGFTDIDGVLRGKYISREKFLSVLPKNFGFCDVVVGWDSNDQLYDNVTYTGWHTAYPDAMARVVPETGRAMPLEKDVPFFLAELIGKAEAICPRGLLRRSSATAGSACSSLVKAGVRGPRVKSQPWRCCMPGSALFMRQALRRFIDKMNYRFGLATVVLTVLLISTLVYRASQSIVERPTDKQRI